MTDEVPQDDKPTEEGGAPSPVPPASPPPVPTDYVPAPEPKASGPNPDAVNKAKGYLLKIGKLMIFLTIIGSCLLLFGAYLISNTIDRIINQTLPK